MNKITLIIASCVSLLFAGSGQAILITWDKTYDTSNFWDSSKDAVLNMVSDALADVSIDRGAITPSGGNSWDWYFLNPSNTSEVIELNNPSVGAGELVVFLGAQDHGPTTLGIGGNTAYGGSGNGAWIDMLLDISTPAHYRAFSGGISINSTFSWYTGVSDAIPVSQFDLYSTVLHELGHVLGMGLYGFIPVWDAYVNPMDNTWNGPNAISSFGSPIPLESDFVHWASGTQQDGDILMMVPTIPAGTRRHFGDAEFAALSDMGYIVVPEPQTFILLLSGAAFIFAIKRKLKASR